MISLSCLKHVLVEARSIKKLSVTLNSIKRCVIKSQREEGIHTTCVHHTHIQSVNLGIYSYLISPHSTASEQFLCIISKHAYLPSQLETLVSIVITIVHFVVALSENHPAHHYSQVDTFRSEVKLLHLGNTENAILLKNMSSFCINKCLLNTKCTFKKSNKIMTYEKKEKIIKIKKSYNAAQNEFK